MVAHWMKTVGVPESDWLLCWVLSLSQSDAGSPTRSIVTPLQAHPTSHTTSLASQFFYSNHHSTILEANMYCTWQLATRLQRVLLRAEILRISSFIEISCTIGLLALWQYRSPFRNARKYWKLEVSSASTQLFA